MSFVPSQTLELIRESVDIVDIVNQYLSLKKVGENYTALCPFHSERTPSFYVSRKKQIFHCFGCGVGGNVFTFLQKIEGISFFEAVKKLAETANISLPVFKKEDRERELLMKIHEEACKLYQSLLRGREGRNALEYLYSRGVKEETIEKFRIGYATKEGISRELLKKFSKHSIQQAGLLFGDHERFKGRIIFPIMNINGDVIGFGARALAEGEAKYINSPQTPLFNKGNVLYGLTFAKEKIKESGYAIIVEGYFDAILCAQEGMENVCATMGTSITKAQIQLLHRYTDQILMFFDPDEAGKKAIKRGADIALQEGVCVKIALLKDDDPADFVLKGGKVGLEEKVKNAKELLLYCFETLLQEMKEGKKKKKEVVEEMLPLIKNLQDPINKREWIKRLAHALDVDEAIVLEGIKDERKVLHHLQVRRESIRRLEERILSHLLNKKDEELMKVLRAEDFEDEICKKIFEAILEEGRIDIASLVERLDEEERNLLTLLCIKEEEEDIEECLKKMQIKILKSKYKEAQKKIGKVPEEEIAKTLYELAKRKHFLTKEACRR